jgi:hypothetical protein
MKNPPILLLAALLATGIFTDANAVTCANGVYRAGCAGPNGAVVAPKGGAVVVVPPARGAVVVPPPRGATVVVPPAAGCVWVNGRKVCR